MDSLLSNENDDTVIYTYWFRHAAYAAALLKEKRKRLKVVTRAVSYDVYEFRHRYNYMPLKNQFRRKMDAVYTISNDGATYLHQIYGFPNNKLFIRRKGVAIEGSIRLPNKADKLVILSIAVFKKVKRVDKIIKSIALFSEKNKKMDVIWHHIGGDTPRGRNRSDELHHLAEKSFQNKNVSYIFHGTIPRQEVLQFLRSQRIDTIINASEIEGIPVSVMEAMVNGIPAIAPDVGGVSELVNNENGILLSKNPEISEISEAIARKEFYKNMEVRQKAHEHVQTYFSAHKNYRQLIEDIKRF